MYALLLIYCIVKLGKTIKFAHILTYKGMKPGIHPENYRLVAFKDMSNDDVFITKSTANSKETIGEVMNSASNFEISIGKTAELIAELMNSHIEIEQEIKRLAIAARDGQITVDDMTGGTFTISNGGVFGSMLSTPIINPPQSGILGMHNIIERPVAIGGKVDIRPMMYLALSYDHRIIDGKESVGFLLAIKEALESPEELLMDNDIEKALEL